MKNLLFASAVATIAIGYINVEGETAETVFVQGADGKPLRVNKSDFDADQADGGAKAYKEFKGEVTDEQSRVGGPDIGEIPPMAAPSAPNFGAPEGDKSDIDPLKNAVAPAMHGENARLVIKEGKKYFVVDGQGNKLSTDELGGVENGFATEDLAWKAVKDLPH